jgi:DNA polymerase-3 subunit gamma/tau
MLTKEAFNALLKTLEEPPEHVKFIFCTTDPEKIPITVLSRCQRFDFSPVSADEIVTRLQTIVESEGSSADPEALRLLARKAAGSVRDSQSLLEQLLSFTSDKITVEAVHDMLGTAGTAQLYGVIAALADRDAAKALTELDGALGEGVDAGQLTEQLLGCIRDLMALSVGGGKELLIHSPESDVDQLSEMANRFGTSNLLAAAQVLDQALMRMRLVTHSRVLLETALIRIAQLEDLQSLSELISQVQGGAPVTPAKKKTLGDESRSPSQSSPSASSSGLGSAVTPKNSGGTEATATQTRPNKEPPAKPAPVGASASQASPAATKADTPRSASANSGSVANSEAGKPGPPVANPATVPEDSANAVAATEPPAAPVSAGSDEGAVVVWRDTMAQLDGIEADFASNFERVNWLDSSGAANSGPKRLVVSFPARYTSSMAFCERPERHLQLEEIATKVAGTKVKLEFRLSAAQAKKSSAKPSMSIRQREREIAQREFVQRAVDLFSGEISSISVPKPNEARSAS